MQTLIEGVCGLLSADSTLGTLLKATAQRPGIVTNWPPDKVFDALATAGQGAIVCLTFIQTAQRYMDTGEHDVRLICDVFGLTQTYVSQVASRLKAILLTGGNQPKKHSLTGCFTVCHFEGSTPIDTEAQLKRIEATFLFREYVKT